MIKTIRTALICWGIITCMIIGETAWIFIRNGLGGFQAFMQEAPFTNIPITLASAAALWLLVGFLLWAIGAGRITNTTLISWVGFFLVSFSYLNILRERIRYGDIDYYIQAASSLSNHQPLPDTYIYPPLWATILSFLMPLGEEGILLVCWIANVLSLFIFFFLLHRVLEHYGFNPQSAALTTSIFMLVNMPILRTLLYVQVNFHVINLIFLGILLYKNRPFLSALALALAVHLKVSPAMLLIAFLLEFNWKWLAWFVLNLLLIAGLTFVAYGIPPYLDFIKNVFLLNAPRMFSMRDNSFDSAIGTLLSYFRADPWIARILVYFGKTVVIIMSILLSLRSQVFFPKSEKGARLFNAIIPLFMAMTLASPLVWEHHGIFITLPFLLLMKKVEYPLEWMLFGTVYLLEFLMPTFDFFPWSYGRLIGMLLLLGLLWNVRGRGDNRFFPAYNRWAAATFGLKVTTQYR